MEADEKRPDKPTVLDYLLAFAPIPIVGEVKAWQVATHISGDSEIFTPDFAAECRRAGAHVPDRTEDVTKRFIAARAAAYVLSPYLVVGTYFAGKKAIDFFQDLF